jgi:hypothetical protein
MLKHKSVSSSSNSTTHGIFTSAVVLRNENNQEFLALEREYTEHYSPLGPSERKLVEEMAVCEWRQRRVWATETAGIDLQMDLDAPGLEKEFEQLDEPVRAAIAIKNLADNSSFLELMHRYETRFSRQYDRALRRLLDLQDRRSRQPEPPQRDRQNLQNEDWNQNLDHERAAIPVAGSPTPHSAALDPRSPARLENQNGASECRTGAVGMGTLLQKPKSGDNKNNRG